MQGQIHNRGQVVTKCRAALAVVKHPMRRNRLIRLIADLSLTQMTSDMVPLLQALTSDERAASARAFGRLGVKIAVEPITLLLNDPVLDVRKAAQTALNNLLTKEPRQVRPATARAADGTRSWVVEKEQPSTDDDNGWKSRLRSIIDA